jgi:hypothetical protein
MELDILETTLLLLSFVNLCNPCARSYMELDILETTLLPSDVIKIKFYRPPNFKFLSGKFKLFI